MKAIMFPHGKRRHWTVNYLAQEITIHTLTIGGVRDQEQIPRPCILGWAVFIGDVRPRREQPAYRRKGIQNSAAAQNLPFVRIGT